MICEGMLIKDLLSEMDRLPEGNGWMRRMRYMQPHYVLELGTGQGASGVLIMESLPAGSRFTTVDYFYPENGRHAEFLEPWKGDSRLKIINADTRMPASLDLVDGGVDFMFLDTTHRAWHAAMEMRLWQSKLIDGAIVVVDDLYMHDMWRFWESLPYDKWPTTLTEAQGTFRYDASKPYGEAFPMGRTSKEGIEC